MFAEINGEKIWCDVVGQGIPMLVPAYSGVLQLQRVLPKYLTKRFKIIYFEPRGAGRSTSNGDITFDEIVNDIEEIRRIFCKKKVVLFGWSSNAFLVQEYARKYPHNVYKMILTAAPPYYNERLFSSQKAYWNNFASEKRKKRLANNLQKLKKQDLSKFSEDRAITLEYVASGPKYFYEPDYNCAHIWEGNHLNTEGIRFYFEHLLKNYDATKYFHELKTPILIIQGKYDFIMPPDLMEKEVTKLPNAKLLTFSRSGHYPFFEEKEKFVLELYRWFDNK